MGRQNLKTRKYFSSAEPPPEERGKAGKVTFQTRKNVLFNYLDKLDLPKGSLLDVGCGEGIFSRYFKRKGYKVTGIDFSRARLTKARKYKGIKFIQKDFMRYVPNQKFDVIFSSVTLMYLPDYVKGIQKMASLLKPNGAIVLLESSADNWILKMRESVVGKTFKKLRGKKIAGANVQRHLFKLQELKSAFHTVGMKITEHHGLLHFERMYFVIPSKQFWTKVENVPKPRFLKKYGSVLLVKAIKKT